MGYKFNRSVPLTVFLLTWSSLLFGQTAQQPTESFAPLNQWKSAIIKGDGIALQGFYDATAQINTPSGQINAATDASFWSAFKAKRLGTKVLQSNSPDSDHKQLMLSVDIYSRNGGVLYVSAAQIWKREGEQWRLATMNRTDATRLEQPLIVSNDIYAPGSDAHAKIKDAIARAAAGHKRVILVFGANWCYDCHVLDAAFHRPDLAAVLDKGYEVVHIDVGRGDANQDLMQQYRVPMKKGIPGLAVLDSMGALIFSQQNGEFENARAMAPEDLLAFLNKWKPDGKQLLQHHLGGKA